MSLIDTILGRKPVELLCSRCERPLRNHEGGECAKPNLSRRFFIGLMGSAAATAIAAKALDKFELVQEEAPAADALVVLAQPKVHRAGSIIINCSPNAPDLDRFQETVERIAQWRGLPVIGMVDGNVVAEYNPIKGT